jgi:NitT/TauT family transport system substrate-binding protein
MKILSRFFLFISILVSALTACSPKSVATPSALTVQLKWVNQAQFAGFYVAADKGYYKEENISIVFSPGGVGINIMDEVTSGRAQFGIIGAEKIILARDEGKRVRAIATIYRRNPFVVVTLPESGITQPADLIGRKINIGGTDGLMQFTAMMSKLSLDINKVNITPYSYDLQPFYNGQIDATPALAAGSLIGILKQRPDANLIWAEDYGIHFYADTIFTTDQMIAENPDLVARFLRATLKGHQYAVENPDEATQISLNYAKDPTLEVQHQMMIASIPLINTGEDHIGWMKPEIWAAMGKTLREQGLLPAPLDVTQVYTMQFLDETYGK